MKIIVWDEQQSRVELSKRLRYSRESRKSLENRWEQNERTIYSSGVGTSPRTNYSFESDMDLGLSDIDNSNSDLQISYAFKNLRFLHAQMSANPPTVVIRPTSNDQDDRKKADAADRLVRYALRQYRMQEKVDRSSLNCLLYGTGIMRMVWDPHKGDLLEMDEETGEMLLEGDIDIRTPSPWNLFIDPDAESTEDIRYLYERIYIPYEEALQLVGVQFEEELKKALVNKAPHGGTEQPRSTLESDKYDVVELFEYWETGLPTNGYLGRHCLCTRDGIPLTQVGPNPHRFVSAGAVRKVELNERLTDEQKEMKISKLPKKARLPYSFFTDIDVPNSIWGKSFLEYISTIQDTINRLDSVTLDSIQAHGVPRLILPEGAEIADDSITNSPWDVVKITGTQPPHFMEPMPTPAIIPQYRDQLKLGIDDMSGVNESMFGQQSREQSGYSMQYATNQGNMIRRRLFNKYVLFVEEVYRTYLDLIRKHWETPKVVSVLGKEKALEAVEVKGADIDGGFDLTVEYGQSLSLDPMTRREEIMALQPLFEKAGVPVRVTLKMMKLNELEGMYDMMQLAEDRQSEIFEEMIANETYIEPDDLQDHENMIAYGLQFFMTTEFKYLEPELQELCKQHIRDRTALAAQEMAPPPQDVASGVPGPVPAPGAPPLETAATPEGEGPAAPPDISELVPI